LRRVPQSLEEAGEADLELAIVLVGPWDVLTRRLEPGGSPRAFGDPEFDRAFARAVDDAIGSFRDAGARVLWITSPPVRFDPSRWPDVDRSAAASDPSRMARLNRLLLEARQRWPDEMSVIDFDRHLQSGFLEVFDPEIRPDGIHFSGAAMAEIVESWLGPEILRLAGGQDNASGAH
jgi:hypothetical protein